MTKKRLGSFIKFKKLSFWLAVVGICSFIISLLNFLYEPVIDLEFKVQNFSSLMDINDKGLDLKVVYNDSLDIFKSDKSISIYEIEIRNNGGKNLRNGDYDINQEFGIQILDGKVLESPKVTTSSDAKYFTDVVKKTTSEKIVLNKKIMDSGSFFIIKFYVLHLKKEFPKITPLGKIAGQNNIEILDTYKADRTELYQKAVDERYKMVMLSLVFSLLFLAGLVYAYLRTIKNQIIIATQKGIIENLLDEKDYWLKEINELKEQK